MTSPRLTVKRWQVDLYTPAAASPTALLQESLDKLKGTMFSQLEQQLEGLALPADQVLVIDRLDVDLRDVDLATWPAQLAIQIARAIQQQAATATSLRRRTDATAARQPEAPTTAPQTTEDATKAPQSTTEASNTTSQAADEAMTPQPEAPAKALRTTEDGTKAPQPATAASDATPQVTNEATSPTTHNKTTTPQPARTAPIASPSAPAAPYWQTPERQALDLWVYFLQHGVLTWNGTGPQAPSLVVLARALAQPDTPPQVFQALQHTIATHPIAARRWIRQAPEALFEAFVQYHTQERPALRALLRQWAGQLPPKRHAPAERTAYRDLVMQLLAAPATGSTCELVVDTSWLDTPLLKTLQAAAPAAAVSFNIQPGPAMPQQPPQATDAQPQPLVPDPAQLPPLLTAEQLTRELVDAPQAATRSLEEVYLDHAGLILLHPLMPSLFAQLGYMDDRGNWHAETAQHEAAYCLHYLAQGTAPTSEADLFIEKLLVGYLLETPWPPVVPWEAPEALTTSLKPLLRALTDQWPPMRNATWATLRQDFLQRPGRLTPTSADAWELVMEPHTLDILLPAIQWGMGIVTYSWMKTMIHVQWSPQ